MASPQKKTWNARALNSKTRARVQEWVSRTCPLIYFYGPSKVGKTTLLGTLLKQPALHEDYCPVYAIDGDQGFATIEDFTDPRLVDLRPFNDVPDMVFAWTMKTLAAAQTADCKAIIYEGMTSVHDHLVAKARLENLGTDSNTLRRMHIAPSQDLGAVIQAVRWIKQYRIAKGTGVPIFVSVNTRGYPIDPKKPESKTIYSPSMSKNLIDRMQRTADAVIELERTQTGKLYLHTQQTNEHPYVAIRNDTVSALVQAEKNLTLPGLLALWASATSHGAELFSKRVTQAQSSDAPDKQESSAAS